MVPSSPKSTPNGATSPSPATRVIRGWATAAGAMASTTASAIDLILMALLRELVALKDHAIDRRPTRRDNLSHTGFAGRPFSQKRRTIRMKRILPMLFAVVAALFAVTAARAETKVELKNTHLCCGQCVKAVGTILK